MFWRGYFAGARFPNSQPPDRSEDETARSTRLIRLGEDSPVWARLSPVWPGDMPAPADHRRMPFLSSTRVPKLARAVWLVLFHCGSRSAERVLSSEDPADPMFAIRRGLRPHAAYLGPHHPTAKPGRKWPTGRSSPAQYRSGYTAPMETNHLPPPQRRR